LPAVLLSAKLLGCLYSMALPVCLLACLPACPMHEMWEKQETCVLA